MSRNEKILLIGLVLVIAGMSLASKVQSPLPSGVSRDNVDWGNIAACRVASSSIMGFSRVGNGSPPYVVIELDSVTHTLSGSFQSKDLRYMRQICFLKMHVEIKSKATKLFVSSEVEYGIDQLYVVKDKRVVKFISNF